MINLSNAIYFENPWPHIIIENFIRDKAAVDVLTHNKSLVNYLRDASDGFRNTVREELNYQQLLDCNDFPSEVIDVISACDQSKELKDLLEFHLLPKLLETYNKPEEYFKTFEKYEFSYGGYSPIQDDILGERLKDTHIDGPKKIYTGMIYFKHPDDHDEHSNFVLESYDENGVQTQTKVLPYSNNIAIFWPNLPNAWHHAQARGKNNIVRRHINFVANGLDDLHDYSKSGFRIYGWKKVHKL